MDIFSLVASFGGGIIGAYMGALPVFIMTGVLAIAGAVASMISPEAGGAIVGSVAFGSYLGPHITFAGGVAAAAFAAKNKKLAAGTDLSTCLNGLADPATLIVGGVFGVIGFLIAYVYGSVLHLNTDLPGMTVATSGIIVRLVFGSTGITGKLAAGEKRTFLSSGNSCICNIILGLGIGTTTGFISAILPDAVKANFPVLCFGIAAVTLIFAQTGFAMPGTHHIALISALAAVASGNPVMGPVFGIIAAIVGDFMGNTFNSHCDSHIDPPAMTIFTLTFVINVVFGSGFFSA